MNEEERLAGCLRGACGRQRGVKQQRLQRGKKEADKQRDLEEVQGHLRGQLVPPGHRAIGL